ncbi:hypothetical protein FRC03_011658 [Tulasnella sp. 419]|nr:hypothetical protein FRC03_011658 [Tulasnella sp. 419]
MSAFYPKPDHRRSFLLLHYSSDWGPMRSAISCVTGWLFGNPKKGPKVLQLDTADESCRGLLLSFFIPRYSQNLVSLVSSILPQHLALLSFNLAEACPHLQELILPDVTILPENITTSNTPLKITHLGLGEVESLLRFNMEDVAMMIKTIDWVNSLPNIRRVTLRIAGHLPPECIPIYYLTYVWKLKCTEKVEIDWMQSNDTLPITDDMIRVLRFPRGMTVGNLHHMNLPDVSNISEC